MLRFPRGLEGLWVYGLGLVSESYMDNEKRMGTILFGLGFGGLGVYVGFRLRDSSEWKGNSQ